MSVFRGLLKDKVRDNEVIFASPCINGSHMRWSASPLILPYGRPTGYVERYVT